MNTLIILLRQALLFVSDNKVYWRYAPAAIIAWIADIWAANTSFRVLVGRGPQNGERTVSDMLENLCKDSTHPDHLFFVETAKMINRRCPTGDHIKAVL